jgi:hypothetical protein
VFLGRFLISIPFLSFFSPNKFLVHVFGVWINRWNSTAMGLWKFARFHSIKSWNINEEKKKNTALFLSFIIYYFSILIMISNHL